MSSSGTGGRGLPIDRSGNRSHMMGVGGVIDNGEHGSSGMGVGGGGGKVLRDLSTYADSDGTGADGGDYNRQSSFPLITLGKQVASDGMPGGGNVLLSKSADLTGGYQPAATSSSSAFGGVMKNKKNNAVMLSQLSTDLFPPGGARSGHVLNQPPGTPAGQVGSPYPYVPPNYRVETETQSKVAEEMRARSQLAATDLRTQDLGFSLNGAHTEPRPRSLSPGQAERNTANSPTNPMSTTLPRPTNNAVPSSSSSFPYATSSRGVGEGTRMSGEGEGRYERGEYSTEEMGMVGGGGRIGGHSTRAETPDDRIEEAVGPTGGQLLRF